MPKIFLAACLLLLPTCSGCATCQKVLAFLFSGDKEWERQEELAEGRAEEQKWLEENRSGAWRPPISP